MSKKRYSERERERRISTALSFIRLREEGVPMATAPHIISILPVMGGVNADKVQAYIYELLEGGYLYVTDGVLKATPKTTKRFKEWVTNGNTQ